MSDESKVENTEDLGYLGDITEHELDAALIESSERSKTKTGLRIALRIVFVVVALGIAGYVLFNIFEGLNFEEIKVAIQELSDAEWMALTFAWIIWISVQGLQTASLVHHMPVRRGVLAYLGPSAVSSVIPGPSDLPVRFNMYQSWGVSRSDAATAVAASGIFSITSQLALPALAGVAIFFGDLQIEGFLTIIVITTLALAVIVVLAAFIVGSGSRTRRAGEILQPALQKVRRIFHKTVDDDEDLGAKLEKIRAETIYYLSDKWVTTSFATVMTLGMKWAILVMSLRFVGIPESALGWAAIGAVFALMVGITMIPITPGAAGVSEIALVGMLAPIAGPEYVNQVAAGVLLYRLFTWLLLIPTGMIALGVWKLGLRQKDKQAAHAA
ncbi:MAG: hypothetical protein DRJ50_05245 [Actinobacteria bacterium]|nr:MAG: hypothetical protein DRJ50_05245 [Actinomycetota bacterium]